MIPLERKALTALHGVSMRMGSSGKRFRRNIAWQIENAEREGKPELKLTARQALYLWFLVDMYRRQIHDEELLRFAAYRRMTGELPDIYLEGDLRTPITRDKPQPVRRELKPAASYVEVCAPLPTQYDLFRAGL